MHRMIMGLRVDGAANREGVGTLFGSTDRLEKQLRGGGGKVAVAHIVDAKKGRFALSSGGDAAQQVASAHINWTLTLQVAPDGEPPFDVVVKEPYPEMSSGPTV